LIEEVFVDCPACGEALALNVDTTAGEEQEYVEDCAVCCRPMAVYVRCEPGTVHSVSVTAE
jgi:Cysteine-rich CPXCG